MVISPRSENKRSGSQGPQSASKVVAVGNSIHLTNQSVEQLSAEDIGKQGNNSGKKPLLLSNPLFIASDEGHSNQFADDDE